MIGNLRKGLYQPCTLELVTRHAHLSFLCLLVMLPWLCLLPVLHLVLAGAVLAVFLVLLGVLDACYGFLYDKLLMPFGLVGLWLDVYGGLPWGLEDALTAALAAGGFFWLLRLVSKGGMGWGDVKYAAVLGLWLGSRGMVTALALALLLGGCAASVMLLRGQDKGDALPFGPFLSLGAYVSYIGSDSLWMWYEGLML